MQDLGADVNQAMAHGITVLLAAAHVGCVAMVRCLVLELGANVRQARDDGVTPVAMAASNGHLDLLRCLVKELGADLNQANKEGMATLSIVACNDCLDVVRCLSRSWHGGAVAVDQANEAGEAPLYFAAFTGHLARDVVKSTQGWSRHQQGF